MVGLELELLKGSWTAERGAVGCGGLGARCCADAAALEMESASASARSGSAPDSSFRSGCQKRYKKKLG
jgi:hypothetical protein